MRREGTCSSRIWSAAPTSANRLPTRVITEFAWHSLFIRNLLIRPAAADLANFVPQMTIIDLPSFRADPARHGCRTETVIAVDLTRMIVLIGGTSYAGEMKKSVFTALNYVLPAKGVMPMHCSANAAPGWRVGGVLRPFGHRKDHAFGRSVAHVDRRRRTWLGSGRHLQFRRRLLRQDDPAVGGSRAGDLRDDPTIRNRSGKCRPR